MNMLIGHYVVRLLLFHFYHLQEEAAKFELTMISIKEKLSKLVNTRIETRIEQGYNFVEALAILAMHQSAAAVVLGIHDRSRIEPVFIGSETLKMAGKQYALSLLYHRMFLSKTFVVLLWFVMQRALKAAFQQSW
jgi:hypothetical protein